MSRFKNQKNYSGSGLSLESQDFKNTISSFVNPPFESEEMTPKSNKRVSVDRAGKFRYKKQNFNRILGNA
jgi:hypothetical protein